MTKGKLVHVSHYGMTLSKGMVNIGPQNEDMNVSVTNESYIALF